jgi:hypothetical protein
VAGRHNKRSRTSRKRSRPGATRALFFARQDFNLLGMRDRDGRTNAPIDETARENLFSFECHRIQPRVATELHNGRRQRERKGGAPIRAGTDQDLASRVRHFGDLEAHKLKRARDLDSIIRAPQRIGPIRPEATMVASRLALECEHVGNAETVIRGAVHSREAAPEQFALDPNRSGINLRDDPSLPIAWIAGRAQFDRVGSNEIGESSLRLRSERSAEGRFDPGETEPPPIAERHGHSIDDILDLRLSDRFKSRPG